MINIIKQYFKSKRKTNRDKFLLKLNHYNIEKWKSHVDELAIIVKLAAKHQKYSICETDSYYLDEYMDETVLTYIQNQLQDSDR